LKVVEGDDDNIAASVHPPKDAPVKVADVQPATISAANNAEEDEVAAASACDDTISNPMNERR
jgi:hypothetical protein